MSVTAKVLSVDKSSKLAIIEAIDDKNGHKIMKSPIKFKQCTRTSIEAVIRKDLKAFQQPVWGGFCIQFYCSID